MANSDKNIVITPNIGGTGDPKIVFSGADATTAAQDITLSAYHTNNGTLSFEGSAGQLFSITNDLTGTLFSVNDVSGIPSIEVDDDGTVRLAEFAGNVLIGTNTDDGTSALQVDGIITATGGNSTNWNTAYSDRNKWDGGSTGLTAATGRTSLGLGTAATTASTAYATSAQGTLASNALPKAGGTLTGTLTSRDIKIGAGYNLQRANHHSGHLEGSYNNVASNGLKSNPIYTIGSSYNPTDAALSGMYGIGYSRGDATFLTTLTGGSTGWGMYVAADGDARIWLDGSTGIINATGGSSTNWNTAYTTANNALPKAGGTMTGPLTIDTDNNANGALRITANQTNPAQDFYFAQEIISTLSGAGATGGDRGQGGIYMDLNSTATGGDTSNEHRVYGAYIDVDSTGDSDLVYGVWADATVTPSTGANSQVTGGYFRAEDNGGAGTVSQVYGVQGIAHSDNSTSDTNNLVGGYFKTGNTADTGVITSATGVYGEIEITSSTPDKYGTSYVFQAQYDNNSTVAQTNTTYLYYGNYAGVLPTTAYGVYIADTVPNVFLGTLRLGDGSTTAASYGFNDDVNTGMYSPANHELGFLANGTQRLKLDSTGVAVTGNISTTGGLTGTTGTFIADTNALFVKTATNGAGAEIAFSDQVSSYAQLGTLLFHHGDTLSYGSGASFTLGSSEATTTILANGKLMYGEGIYSKPASGTGAGTLVISSSRAVTATTVGVTNIVTDKVVKFNGTILDDSNITDTGSLITLGSNTTVNGVVKHPGGSAAAPSITFTSDTNTGIYSTSADTVNITTGGAQRAYFNSAGVYFNEPLQITSHNNANGALRILANQTNPNQDLYFAQEIISNLSGSAVTTGDREQGGIYLDINSSATGGGTSHEHRVYGIYADVDSTGDADNTYGILVSATATPTTGTTSVVVGGSFWAEDNGGAGSTTSIYGVSASAYSDNSSADPDNMYGAWFKAYNAADSATMGTIHGCYTEVEVNGTIDQYTTAYVYRAEFDNNTGINGGASYLFYGNYAGVTGSNNYGVYIVDAVPNYLGGSLSTGGDITSAGNITANSDERLKTDIETIPSALEKVNALRGVTFDMNGERGLGVIAQETEAVIPEVVHTADDEMGTKSVAYGNMVGLLIEAIKEQQVQIDELKIKLEKLV